MEKNIDRKVIAIKRSEYIDFIGDLKHLFLVGDLQMPTPHPFVRDERLEFIYCNYQPGDTGIFHWHRTATEYEFVIVGNLSYLDVGTQQLHYFQTGDFIVIPPSICVYRKVHQPTTTLTVKVPSLAEKVYCAQCQRDCSSRIEPYQFDFPGVSSV